MEYNLILAIISLGFVVIAFVLMQISKRKFTEGYFRNYINLVVFSGTLMSIYLLLSLMSKLELSYTIKIKDYIKLLGYISMIFTAIVFVKSSIMLDKIVGKYSFKEHKFFKQFKKEP